MRDRQRRRTLRRLAAAALLIVTLAPPSAVHAARRRPATAPSRAPAERLVWHVETLAGEVVDAKRGDEAINPASVVKVATTLWALERLGPEHRFVTTFGTDAAAPPANGVLEGDVRVTGGGDPDFQAENALLVARRLNELGVRRATGALVVDHRFWIGWEGGSARREGDPTRRGRLMGARLRAAFDSQHWNNSLRQAWRRLATARGWNVSRPPRVIIAGPTRVVAAAAGRALVLHESGPLVDALRRFNCFSNNDIERVVANVGLAEDMAAWLAARWGAPADALRFATTSGLGENRMTPRQVVALLRDLRETCGRLNLTVDSVLPSAGCDPGTVTRFFPRLAVSAGACAVVGKTGTLTMTDGGVAVFAGFVNTARGELVFCVASPGAAGRLKHSRWLEEQWLLDLAQRNGGFLEWACRGPLAGAWESARVHAATPGAPPEPGAARLNGGPGARTVPTVPLLEQPGRVRRSR